jgi:hypothetical protein
LKQPCQRFIRAVSLSFAGLREALTFCLISDCHRKICVRETGRRGNLTDSPTGNQETWGDGWRGISKSGQRCMSQLLGGLGSA